MQNLDIAVSICCLAYNQEKFLKQTIDGFLSQKTSFRIEIIIHDDASTDGTTAIIKEYENKYPDLVIPIYQSENQYSKNIKPSATYLWPRARGKYIALCEGDDYWTDPDKLQKQFDFLESNPDFAICCHNALVKDEDGSEDYFYCSPNQLEITSIENIVELNFIPTASVVFRNSSLMKELPAWYFKMPIGDWPLHILNAQYGKIRYFNDCMAVYRKHGNSVWSSKGWVYRMESDLKVFEAVNKHFNGRFYNVIQNRISNQVEWKYDLINTCLTNNNDEEADNGINELMTAFPDRIDAKYIGAITQIKLNRFEEAEQELQKLIEIQSSIQRKGRQPELNLAESMHPATDRIRKYANELEELLIQKESERTKDRTNTNPNLAESNQKMIHQLRSCFNKLNQLLLIEETDRMLELEQKLEDRIISAEKLIQEGNLKAAKLELQSILSTDPKSIDALNDLSVLEILDGNFINAFNVLSAVMKFDPQNEVALGNIEYLKNEAVSKGILLEFNKEKEDGESVSKVNLVDTNILGGFYKAMEFLKKYNLSTKEWLDFHSSSVQFSNKVLEFYRQSYAKENPIEIPFYAFDYELMNKHIVDPKAPWFKYEITNHNVPGMITDEEKQYYLYISRFYSGAGKVLELGPWLGCSTSYIAGGLKGNPNFNDKLFVYDDFLWRSSWMDGCYNGDDRPNNHEVFRSVFEKFISPYKELIEVEQVRISNYDGNENIKQLSWNKGNIEIAFIDCGRNIEANEAWFKILSPSFMPNKTLLVLQDWQTHKEVPVQWYNQMKIFTDSKGKSLELIHEVSNGGIATFLFKG